MEKQLLIVMSVKGDDYNHFSMDLLKPATAQTGFNKTFYQWSHRARLLEIEWTHLCPGFGQHGYEQHICALTWSGS